MLAIIALSLLLPLDYVHDTVVGSVVATTCVYQEPRVTWVAQPPPNLPRSTVYVDVTVGPSGHVLATRVVKSSGNPSVDRVGVETAAQSKYAPATRNCKPVQGIYRFMLRTNPNRPY